jgi:hypothetical protein
MAKTAAERQKLRRERVKANADEYSRYLARERERKRILKGSMNGKERQMLMMRERKASDRYYQKIKERKRQNEANTTESLENAFKSKQSMGKAKKRARNALPMSPTKRKAIIMSLASQYIPESPNYFKNVTSRESSISEETKLKVIAFYLQESRVMPGKADVVVVRSESDGKTTKQKQLMTMTVMELYQEFKTTHPEALIGKSKFASLRPPEVLLCSKTPRNVCGCTYHQNVILLMEALHQHSNFPLYSRDNLLGICICPGVDDLETCVANECDNCQNLRLFWEYAQSIPSEICSKLISVEQWSSGNDGFLLRQSQKLEFRSAVQLLASQLPRFLWHIFIKDQQATAYEEDKVASQLPDSSVALVQVDFAENYTAVQQDEIQSAHWRQRQITVYTVMIYFRKEITSWVIASDFLSHDKVAVSAFAHEILEFVTSSMLEVKEIHFWSDGPSSQYKNRYILASLLQLSTVFSAKITWSYFATSHGKSANDALGGRAKRIAYRKMVTRTQTVHNAVDFANALKDSNMRTTVRTEDSIRKTCEDLQLFKMWDRAPIVPGIINTHHVEVHPGSVQLRLYNNGRIIRNQAIQAIPIAGAQRKLNLHFFK